MRCRPPLSGRALQCGAASDTMKAATGMKKRNGAGEYGTNNKGTDCKCADRSTIAAPAIVQIGSHRAVCGVIRLLLHGNISVIIGG